MHPHGLWWLAVVYFQLIQFDPSKSVHIVSSSWLTTESHPKWFTHSTHAHSHTFIYLLPSQTSTRFIMCVCDVKSLSFCVPRSSLARRCSEKQTNKRKRKCNFAFGAPKRPAPNIFRFVWDGADKHTHTKQTHTHTDILTLKRWAPAEISLWQMLTHNTKGYTTGCQARTQNN